MLEVSYKCYYCDVCYHSMTKESKAKKKLTIGKIPFNFFLVLCVKYFFIIIIIIMGIKINIWNHYHHSCHYQKKKMPGLSRWKWYDFHGRTHKLLIPSLIFVRCFRNDNCVLSMFCLVQINWKMSLFYPLPKFQRHYS